VSETIIEAVQPETEAAVKPYKFRTLGGEDVFLMFRIIGKIGVKEFNACFENNGIKNLVAAMMGERMTKAENDGAEEEKSFSVTYIEVILEVADVIFRNIPKCEDDIFKMLSQTSDLSVEQVKKLNLADFTEMVIDFIKKEEFKDFIKVVSKLFK
jgi:hypothetical protein